MSAPSIVIVQGRVPLHEWQARLAPHAVVSRELDRASWLVRDGRTWCIDASGPVEVAGVSNVTDQNAESTLEALKKYGIDLCEHLRMIDSFESCEHHLTLPRIEAMISLDV